jgi:hypothetical protein
VYFKPCLKEKTVEILSEDAVEWLHYDKKTRVHQYIQQNSKENIYYYVSCWANAEQQKNNYFICKLKQDGVTSKFSFETENINTEFPKIVERQWYRPFYDGNNNLIFFPKEGSYDKLFEVPLNDSKVPSLIFLSGDNNRFPSSNSLVSTPKCYGGRIFFYMFCQQEKTGCIWSMNPKNHKWTLETEFEQHSVQAYCEMQISDHGSVFVHGNCAEETCEAKAHIHQYDLAVNYTQYYCLICV